MCSPEMNVCPALVKRALGRDGRIAGRGRGKTCQPKSDPLAGLICRRTGGMVQQTTGADSVGRHSVGSIHRVVRALPRILPSERPQWPEFREKRQSGIFARWTSNRDGHLTNTAFSAILDGVDVLLKPSLERPQISAAWTPFGCAVGTGAVTRGAHRHKPRPAFLDRLFIPGKRIGRRHLRLGVYRTLQRDRTAQPQATHDYDDHPYQAIYPRHRHALASLSTTNQGMCNFSHMPWRPSHHVMESTVVSG